MHDEFFSSSLFSFINQKAHTALSDIENSIHFDLDFIDKEIVFPFS